MGITALFMITLVLGCVLRSQAHKMGGGGGGRGGGGGERFDLRPWYLWSAVAVLFASGTLAVNTFIGDLISAVSGLAPWVGWCWAIVLVFGTIKDLWSDREPDKVAPWFLFMLPSVTNSLPGEFGQLLQDMWTSYGDKATEILGRIFGV